MKHVTGYDGSRIAVGDRVELHPATDLWMQGRRYGYVTSIRDVAPVAKGQTVLLTLDRAPSAQRFSTHPDNIRKVE